MTLTPLEEAVHSPRLIRFGAFEVDLPAGELHKSALKLKLTATMNIFRYVADAKIAVSVIVRELEAHSFLDGAYNR